jgi:hypothetical protein
MGRHYLFVPGINAVNASRPFSTIGCASLMATVHEARRTCATVLVDLEVHSRVIMLIRRNADVSMMLEIYASSCADGDARSAAQVGGHPFDAQVNSRLRCCTGRILLLYWQQRGPHQLW